MVRFITRILIFMLLLASLAFAFDFAIEAGLRKTEIRLFKSWNKIIKGGINAQIVVLGNSRAYRHFNPEIISQITQKSFYNLGMDGYSFKTQAIKYGIYTQHNSKPQVVVINVDHATLNNNEIGFDREQFLPYLNHYSFQHDDFQKSFSWAERKLPVVRYFGCKTEIPLALLEFTGIKHYNDKEINGYWQEDIKWKDEELACLLDSNFKLNFSFNEKESMMLEEFIRKRVAEGIKVILVWSPIQVDGLKILVDNVKNRDFYNALAKRNNIPFLDYSNDAMCYDTRNFTNYSHLNTEGVKVFNQKFANDLIRESYK